MVDGWEGVVHIKHKWVNHEKRYNVTIRPNGEKQWTERNLNQEDVDDIIAKYRPLHYFIEWERV